MTYGNQQDQVAAWVHEVIRGSREPNKLFLLRIASQCYFPLYAPSSGLTAGSVLYVFRRGFVEELPKVLNGEDMGRPDKGQAFKVFELEHGWKYAAIRLDASEEMSSTFEWMAKARIVQALEAMEKP